MRTEKSPTRMDCRAFKRSSNSGDAPPLTRLSGISAATSLGAGPLVLSSPTESLFGCIVSSGADELAHDVTGAGALSRPYRGAAVIFGLAGSSQRSLGTWDWNRPCPPSAAGAMARAQRIPTARPPRRTIHRPCAEECLATGWTRPCRIPLGASRSDHLLTPQTRQRSNSSADQGKISTNENIYEFQSVSAPQATAWREGEGPQAVPRPRPNQGATRLNDGCHECGAPSGRPMCIVRRLSIAHCLAFRRRAC